MFCEKNNIHVGKYWKIVMKLIIVGMEFNLMFQENKIIKAKKHHYNYYITI